MTGKIGNISKIILAILICTVVCWVSVKSHPYTTTGKFIDAMRYLKQDNEENNEGQLSVNEQINMLKNDYSASVWGKSLWLDLNGNIARFLNMRGYYSSLGIYVTDDNYIVSPSAKTTTDYEVEQIVDFKKYLDKNKINLLYINAPTKYVDDSIFADEFGIESYSNRNADLFLKRIREKGINCVDLREELEHDRMNIYEMFYRTDHHWTTRSGLWATGKLAQALNRYCGYHIPQELYDENNYYFTDYNNCWLGEQGRKIAASYVGLDDFTEIKPKFQTDFSAAFANGESQGDFDIFVNEDCYHTGNDVYADPSWHYSYGAQGLHGSSIHNNKEGNGKILVLGDSYSQVVVPFLSLGVADVNTLVLREYNGDLHEYIEENDFDTVVILYAQFMIGAHDDPASANYRMFTFH